MQQTIASVALSLLLVWAARRAVARQDQASDAGFVSQRCRFEVLRQPVAGSGISDVSESRYSEAWPQ
jgi:membrane protein implicated in regulation of membrane protease activity